MSDMREVLAGVKLPGDGAELPRLVHIINTHNEGVDVRQTIISFRAAYSGPYTAIVVADETTDGSCDDLSTDELFKEGDLCPACQKAALGYCCGSCDASLANGETAVVDDGHVEWMSCGSCDWTFDMNDDASTKIEVIRNNPRVGCGRAKEQARLEAEKLYPDCDYVIVHSDGHCRWLEGSLDEAVLLAYHNDIIVSPGVAPLHCPADEQPRIGADWGDRQTKLKHSHTTWGGSIVVDALGCKVDARGRPRKEYAFREATFWAIFLMSGKTLRDRLGGWNELPGRWGSQEIGLALRAWFADLPIVTMRDAVAGHRYRADQRKDKKPYSPYSIRTSERRANHRYTHQIVFSPKTCMKVWKPNWKELCPSAGAEQRIQESALGKQGAAFRSAYKRKTDAEFQETFCRNGWPNKLIPLKDITAVVLCYRRPENQQKCIDAIRKEGIKVWAWCNAGAKPPTGCDRIFTDSMNASTWGRYCIAPLVDTPWILFCDDDVELTGAGVRALRAGGALGIDNSGLIGAKFKPPGYDDYHKRSYFKSHDLREATPVDMLWPKGQLIYRDLAVQLFGEGNALWQEMRAAVGSTSGDDLVSTIVQSMLSAHREPFGRYAHVVPSSGKGYREHHGEGKKDSLTKQPGRLRKKRGTMKTWRGKYGWRSVDEHKAAGTFEQPAVSQKGGAD